MAAAQQVLMISQQIILLHLYEENIVRMLRETYDRKTKAALVKKLEEN